MTAASSENHHYVPQLLLRNFASPKKKQHYIHVFDKHNGRTFNTNVSNIASERGFYEFTHEGKSSDFEGLYSKLETKVSDAFKEIILSSNLKSISNENKDWIYIFIAMQQCRSTNFRAMTKSIDEQFVDRLKDMGADPNNVHGYKPFSDDEDIKKFSIYFAFKSSEQFATLLKSKVWFLLKTDDAHPFWIGDNPVTLHNETENPHGGNLGLALKGIQIHLPLSPNLTLALWCPFLVKEIVDGLNKAKKIVLLEKMRSALYFGEAYKISQEKIRLSNNAIHSCSSLAKTFTKTGILHCDIENVKFYNSLQVRFSERYVMSKTDDFELVNDMLKDGDHMRNGLRMKLM